MKTSLFCVCLLVLMVNSRLLTKKERSAVLKEHNRIRSLVANGKAKYANGDFLPTATDMRKMTWDEDLAKDAEAWTKSAPSCQHAHDLFNKRQGENLAMTSKSSTTPNDLKDMVTRWWEEVSVMPGTLGSGNTVCHAPTLKPGNQAIGHATQVIWAKSGKLGCAIGSCSKWNTWLVCRYAEMGNFQFNGVRTIYNPGKTCAACPGKCQDGLCKNAAVGDSCKDPNVDTGSSGGEPVTAPTLTEDQTTCKKAPVEGHPLNDWAMNNAGGNACLCTTKKTDGSTGYNAKFGDC